MRKESGKGKAGKGNDGGGGSRLHGELDIEKKWCLTIPEVADLLGISRNFAYELARRGEIPVIRFGKRKLVPRIALENKLAEAK
jgi:excisionase family DNA binding protein